LTRRVVQDPPVADAPRGEQLNVQPSAPQLVRADLPSLSRDELDSILKCGILIHGCLAPDADSINLVLKMNAPVDAGYFIGMGCVRCGDAECMLTLTDIERLMSSGEMRLLDATSR